MSPKFTAIRRDTGMVLFSGSAQEPNALRTDEIDILVGCEYVDGWVTDGVNHLPSKKPSTHHTFDYTTKQWIDPRTPEQIAADLQADITKATQTRLDAFARTRNYDGILSAATYATSAVPKFAAEGQYCVESRDATWAALYAILAEVEAGTLPMPSGYADIEPLLPTLTWPT